MSAEITRIHTDNLNVAIVGTRELDGRTVKGMAVHVFKGLKHEGVILVEGEEEWNKIKNTRIIDLPKLIEEKFKTIDKTNGKKEMKHK